MALDSNNVLVAMTGSVWTADLGATPPVDADAVWGTGWVDLGWISEDGVGETPDDATIDINAWQNGATVRTLITSSVLRFHFTVIETNAKVLELYYRGAELTGTGTGPAVLKIGAPKSQRHAFGLDVIDGDRIIRKVIPSGEVTERGDITYKNDEPIGYELTVTAYPGTDGISVIQHHSELAGLAAA